MVSAILKWARDWTGKNNWARSVKTQRSCGGSLPKIRRKVLKVSVRTVSNQIFFLGFRYVRNGRHFARNTFSMELVPIPLCREIQYDKTTSFDRACSFLRANFRLHPTIMTSHYDNKTFCFENNFFWESTNDCRCVGSCGVIYRSAVWV